MIKINDNKLRKIIPNYIYYIVIIFIALSISIPLCMKGLINTHDGMSHLARNYATVRGLLEGQIPSLIASNFCNDFGYSWNIFYPPLSTIISAVFKVFTSNFTDALKITIVFSVILSGITMFKLMLRITKNSTTSLVTAIIYITSMYLATDIYVRMAMGEIIAYSFIPILLSGLYDILYNRGEKSYLLTIGACGIILSHNITTLLMIGVVIIFVIIYSDKLFNKNNIKIWKKILINVIFILMITAFFYIPFIQNINSTIYRAMVEGNMTTTERTYQNSLYLYQIIFGKYNWGYSLSLDNGIDGEMNFSLGLPIIIMVLYTPFVYKKIKQKKLYLTVIFIGLIFVFMSTNVFPWRYVPYIFSIIQFPWRLLMISTVMFTIIAGINIEKVIQNLDIKCVCLIIITMVIYILVYILSIVSFNKDFNEDYLNESNIIESTITDRNCSAYEYLPQKTKVNYILTRENKVEIISGDILIKDEKKENLDLEFSVQENSSDSKLELPYIYYLGYTAKLNGIDLKIGESKNGFLCTTIPKDFKEGKVIVKYKGTVLSKISVIISILGISMLIIYIIVFNRNYIKKKMM